MRARTAARTGRAVNRLSASIRRPVPSGPPKVGVVCDSFIRYGSAQAVGLKEAGIEVAFYYVDRLNEFNGSDTDRERYLQKVRDAGIETIPLPRRNLRKLWRQTRDLHIDLTRRRVTALVVQSHIDPRYLSLGFRYPSAVVVHDPRPHSGDFASAYPLPVRAMARLAELSATGLIIHSDRLVSQLYPIVSRVPLAIVPHGASMREEGPVAVPESSRLVLVGRLMAYKGIDTALEAFPRVRASFPDSELILAGRGKLGDQIRATAPPGVTLRDGYIPDDELDALIDSARVVLLPYRDATQSGVGLQAVSRGIPCAVSDAGALPDLVPEAFRPSWVATAGDSDDLARAIIDAMRHSSAERQQVYDDARTRFAWEAVGVQLLRELGRLGVVGAGSSLAPGSGVNDQ